MRGRFLVVALVVTSLVVAVGSLTVAAQAPKDAVQPRALGWLYANHWDVVFDDWELHGLAVWNNGSCSDPHYVGPGGDASTCSSSHGCINQWTWWQTTPQGKLGVPKSWVAAEFWNRYNIGNYKAWCSVS